MDFATLPPEVNSGLDVRRSRFWADNRSGHLLGQPGSRGISAAGDYGSVISGLTSGPWRGPASTSMVAAAAPYVSWMNATAAQAEQAADQAKAAASAYEAAFTATVAPPVIAANRTLLASLIATNMLGQNTPAIATTEAHYAEMWAQDAAAMYGLRRIFRGRIDIDAVRRAAGDHHCQSGSWHGNIGAAVAAGDFGPRCIARARLACDVNVGGVGSQGLWNYCPGIVVTTRPGSSMFFHGADRSWRLRECDGTRCSRPASTRRGNMLGALYEFVRRRGCGSTCGSEAGGTPPRPPESAARWRPQPRESADLGSAGAVSAALGRGTAIGALAVPPSWTVVPPR